MLVHTNVLINEVLVVEIRYPIANLLLKANLEALLDLIRLYTL